MPSGAPSAAAAAAAAAAAGWRGFASITASEARQGNVLIVDGREAPETKRDRGWDPSLAAKAATTTSAASAAAAAAGRSSSFV